MELQFIRQQFVELTGRYDLLEKFGHEGKEQYKADFFINAGTRVLDRKVTADHVQLSVSLHQVPPDVPTVQVPRCWQVHEVWGLPMDGSGLRIKLQETQQTNRFQNFFNRPPMVGHPLPSSWIPTHYAILTTRNEQQLEKMIALKADTPANYAHTNEWGGWVLSLELYPHQRAHCMIEVRGKFYSPELTTDVSTNMWSQFYPSLLIKAACHVLEVFYRNTEGANDWLNAMNDELLDVEKMQVETEARKFWVMEG